MRIYLDAKDRPALLCILIGHVIVDGACTRTGCRSTNLEE